MKSKLLLLCLITLYVCKTNAQAKTYENDCVRQFENLCEFIRSEKLKVDSFNSNVDIQSLAKRRQQDSTIYNAIYQDYFVVFDFTNRHGFGKNELAKINGELKQFSDFLATTGAGRIKNYSIKPIKHSKNEYMLAALDSFNISRSFIMFDKTQPEKELLYLFFLPPVYDAMGGLPKILSWKMQYTYNQFYFIDLLGHEGTEVFFKGVQAPKNPIDIRKELQPFKQ